MLLTVTPLEDPGPPSPAPPPTAPKPSKDNARLQRLLRKAAKRSGVQQHPPAQPPKSFRSTLSPVNEADLESLERAASPRKHVPPTLTLPPRFQIRTTTHRVPSPYPKHRSFTFTVSEQHSLNQYLCSPPPRDSPSPHPLRAITPTTPTAIQEPTSIPTITPQETSGPATLKAVPPNKSASFKPPENVVASSGFFFQSPKPTGLLTPSAEDHVDHSQSGTVVRNTDRSPVALKIGDNDSETTTSCLRTTTIAEVSRSHALVEQESGTFKHGNGCSPIKGKTPPFVDACTPMATEKSVSLSPCSTSTDIPQITLTLDLGPTNGTESQKTPEAIGPVSLGDAPKSPATQVINPPATAPSTLPKPALGAPPPFAKQDPTEEMNLLKCPERAKPPRRKPGGGWARLVKHLVVEPEEIKFPEPQKTEGKEEKTVGEAGTTTDGQQQSRESRLSRANKMWDALLYHMGPSTKGPEKTGSVSEAPALPFLRSRLPLLLHRPRFDARKLKEAASRPLRKVTAFFHRRTGEKPATSFNRTASGWSIRGEDAEKLVGGGSGEEQVKEAA
ncbi:proline-rich protein 33 [Pelodytes ibericus]